MIRKEHAMAWAAARIAALAAVLCVAGCAWATALDDLPGTAEIYTASEADAAIAAATGAIHVAEADFTPSNAVLVATIEEVAPAPGNYLAVSNAAMNARAKTDLNVYTNGLDGTSVTNIATGDRLATTGEVAKAVRSVKTDLITDNTNTIDAAGNVYSTEVLGDWVQSEGPTITNARVYWYSDDDNPAGWYLEGDEITQLFFLYNSDLAATNVGSIIPSGPLYDEYVGFRRSKIYPLPYGRLALTNDIPTVDYTTSNSQLVATIEATAPKVPSGIITTNQSGQILVDTTLSIIPNPDNEDTGVSSGGASVYVGGIADANAPEIIIGQVNPLSHGGILTINGMNGGCIKIGGGDYFRPAVISYNGTNLVESKQDALPYPTNAIPYAAISGTPSLSGYATHAQVAEAAVAATNYTDNAISTNNAAFVSAVLAAPLTGAAPSDLAELSEYGSYGTVGAAILALIAGLAALKRRMGMAETALVAKANYADLPYAMVTPGEWKFSGLPEDDEYPWSVSSGPTFMDDGYGEDHWVLVISNGNVPDKTYESSVLDVSEDDLTVVLHCDGMDDITATRASLPGHLPDRAGNRVVVDGDTTLTLPAAVPGYIRDFLVRLEISGSTVPTITFQGQGSEAPNGADEITYETDGDEFPVPDEAGTWSYSFTENCVAHKFAVSLKKVNVVTQGGE